MPYSLFDNPFAVLGLANSASVEQASDRARQIGTPEAEAAKRSLIVPRARLEAEIRFLPGVTLERTVSTLAALRAGKMPDLRQFPFLACANVLAHLASDGKGDPATLRELSELQPRLTRDIVLDLITADRAVAGAPRLNGTLLDQALAALAVEHAGALVIGLRSLGEIAGAELLVGLVQSAQAGNGRWTGFIAKASSAWERETASRATELLEKAAQAGRSLSSKATAKVAEELALTIRTWSKLTAPQRALDLSTVLRHEGSVAPVRRWRELAVDIANEQGAAREALTIIKELVEHFAALPDLGDRLRQDFDVCQGLVVAAREHDAISKLEAAIAEADGQRETLSQYLDGNEPTGSVPQVVANLRDALVQALQTAPGERPWLVWRAFAYACTTSSN
jgi:hypothetical protein